jgi:hypothetical protein
LWADPHQGLDFQEKASASPTSDADFRALIATLAQPPGALPRQKHPGRGMIPLHPQFEISV